MLFYTGGGGLNPVLYSILLKIVSQGQIFGLSIFESSTFGPETFIHLDRLRAEGISI